MRQRTRLTLAILVGAGLAAIPLAVFAHSVSSVQGTVSCSGGYSITATGDVYGGVHLIVDLDGTTIENVAETGTSSVQTFGPFTGSGAHAGETISAEPSDGGAGANGVLVASPTVCPTPTPTPTATPSTTPTPVVVVSPPTIPPSASTPITGAGFLTPLIIGVIGLFVVLLGMCAMLWAVRSGETIHD